MTDRKSICCCYCKNVVDNWGNFVECKLLQKGLDHTFVDWYYWHGTAPDNCPLKREGNNAENNEGVNIDGDD